MSAILSSESSRRCALGDCSLGWMRATLLVSKQHYMIFSSSSAGSSMKRKMSSLTLVTATLHAGGGQALYQVSCMGSPLRRRKIMQIGCTQRFQEYLMAHHIEGEDSP